MKTILFKRIFEITIVIVGLVLLGWYLASTTHVSTLVVENEFNVQENESVEVVLDGEVKSPGTYRVLRGTLLYDVVRMAGGATQDADLSSIDLSLPVVADTTQTIPEKVLGVSVKTVRGSNDEIEGNDGLCNINTASLEEISNLPGIGDVIANAIVDYRTENGDFKNKEEIKKVKGIGDKIFEKISDCITVG